MIIRLAALAPGFAYSENFDLDLAILNWTQGFAAGRAGYAVGRLTTLAPFRIAVRWQ
jgi:hypothetical protein